MTWDKMKDFAAIDFETANKYRSSVCSVGIVIVNDYRIVDEYYSLIRPLPNYYNAFTTSIHGLSRKDTEHSRTFPEVWAEVSSRIDGLPLVAHNAAFDRGCLKAVFEAYGMTYPNYEFHCTCIAARRFFGKSLPDHKLVTVSRQCGYELLMHHDALADAEACAHIAIKIL